jgi:pyruvate formate lyase activating enzyme
MPERASQGGFAHGHAGSWEEQCGLRKNEGGRLIGVSAIEGKFSWYHDPLPTNCVADWVCPGGTGAGYPRYAHAPGPECGYKNLAVFFSACNFNCLYCQNWHFKTETFRPRKESVASLVSSVDERTSCICYFATSEGTRHSSFPSLSRHQD